MVLVGVGVGPGGSEGPEMTKQRLQNFFVPLMVQGNLYRQSR